jgi:CRP-like cAMP-binding protein
MNCEKGFILFKPDDHADSVYFVEDGIVEFYTKFEGNEFILERLKRGSIINFRTFFMDD